MTCWPAASGARTGSRSCRSGWDLARYRGGDRLAARQALGISTDEVAVVMVGRLVPIKRVDRLIRVFAEVRAKRVDAHLYVIGDGSERAAAEGSSSRGRIGRFGDVLRLAIGHDDLVFGCRLRRTHIG